MEDIKQWIKKIEAAEKKYEPYHALIKEIRAYYRNEKSKNKHNIFWSTIETLKPFLYFKQPKPYVEQKQKTNSPIETIACRILEKALNWDLEKFDFDSVVKYVRNDFLLVGFGAAYERYVPTFKKCFLQSETDVCLEILEDEKVETVYLNPEDFIADTQKVFVWEDCSWVARKIFMTVKEAEEQFGQDLANLLSVEGTKSDEKSIKVYEIWDKADKQILYLSKECSSNFLKILKDTAKVSGFFTMPKPMFATLTNDGLIPLPDYEQLKPLLEELSGVTNRMQLSMQAIKVSGAYDNSFPELANILNKDVTLVAVSDFDRLKENGGLRGIIDFAPIEQYVNALEALAARREDIMSQIYEITGVSDIMRGNSDKVETATAVAKKTNFGTLRNQDRQNDMIRFITDLLKIKAEMICECFSRQRLKCFADENIKDSDVDLAIEVLKTDKLRGMVLGVQTDTAMINSDLQSNLQNTISAIHQLIVQAFDVVSSQPLLLDLYRQMIESLTTTLPNARMYEPVISKAFEAISLELKQKEAPEPNLAVLQLKQEEQKMLLEHKIKEKEVAIKEAELVLKKNEQDRKTALENKEMELQATLKAKELDEDKKTNTNISTGYVKGF